MSLKCRLSSRWPGLTIRQDNGCGDGEGLKGVGLTVNHLILDDEHVSGYGDEGDKGWLPASVVSDDELGDGAGLKGVGLTVN